MKIISSMLMLCVFMALSITAFAQVQADFTWSPQPACAGQPVTFTDNSVGFPGGSTQYTYYFGDGNNWWGQTTSTTHTYSTAGTYVVVYQVLDSLQGIWDSTSKVITVVAGPCTTPDTINGQVYYDVNGNGSYDSGDFPMANQLVDVSGTKYSTDANGEYSVAVNAGTFTVSLSNTGVFSVATPMGGSHSIVAPGSGSNFTADFSLTAGSPVQDVAVGLTGSWMRPGFKTYNWISYTNLGTVPVSGTITYTYHDSVSYLSSNPTGTHNATVRQLTYSYSNLLPSETRSIRLELQLAASVPLGTFVSNSASITPTMGDANVYNNTAVFADSVIGSYDPNDKAVSPSYGPEGYVLPDETLTYRIRFQNTGTASAINVSVVDTLEGNLDLSTFQMLDASHSYDMTIDNNRTVTWTFANINLPDSTSDEPNSHGFIRFTIKPMPNLPELTAIHNFCDIYFDFNAPVRTNTTLTTINSATSIDPPAFEGFDIYPNPATDRVIVKLDNAAQTDYRFVMTDIQGRIVRQVMGSADRFEVNVNDLSTGMYLYQIKATDGRTTQGKILVK